jgi:hypothetical protein
MSDLRTHIDDMLTLVIQAERKVHEGVIVNVGTLESDVAALCARITQGDPAQAREMQPAMADLITHLDALAAALDAFKQEHNTKT